MEEQLTTKQVALALKVSESSVKRWCDCGAISTIRTVGGHRRIPLAGLMQFLDKTNQNADLNFVTTPPKANSVKSEVSREQLCNDFTKSVMEGDESEARKLLSLYFASCESVAQLADQLIASTFHRIGDAWGCGDLEVYQERRACELCRHLLQELRRLQVDPPETASIAIGGSPAGDNYSLPNLLIDLVLRQASMRAVNLGENLPFETLARAALDLQPALFWLSVSHIENESHFVSEFREFRNKIPSHIILVVGGRALTDSVRPHIEYTVHCDNMLQLDSLARALNRRS